MPQWILREFGIGDLIINPAAWQRGEVPIRRTHPWSRLAIKDVCARCNSGWLSQLENTVKPVIPLLATGERNVTALTDEESLTLGRWGAKTAFLYQRTAAIPAVVPMDAFWSLRDTPRVLPAGTCVFAFQDDGQHAVPINGLQTQDWTAYTSNQEAINLDGLIRSTCKISFRIGRLHLLIAYFGSTGLEAVGWHRVHHPVFPRHCRLWIDAGFRIDRVSPRQESAMVLFHVSLGIALKCTQDQISQKAPPTLEDLHEEFFRKHRTLE